MLLSKSGVRRKKKILCVHHAAKATRQCTKVSASYLVIKSLVLQIGVYQCNPIME